MDPAWIAVVGILGGVIVTATSAVAVASLTTRSQRLTLDRRRDHDLTEHRRAERHEAFVDYLAALRTPREDRGPEPHPRTAPLAEQVPAEVARFSRAYQALRIFSNSATGEAAHDCSSHLWDLADTVRRNDTHAIDRDRGSQLRRILRAAMQHELSLDPRTGCGSDLGSEMIMRGGVEARRSCWSVQLFHWWGARVGVGG